MDNQGSMTPTGTSPFQSANTFSCLITALATDTIPIRPLKKEGGINLHPPTTLLDNTDNLHDDFNDYKIKYLLPCTSKWNVDLDSGLDQIQGLEQKGGACSTTTTSNK